MLELKDFLNNLNFKNTKFILAPSNIYFPLFKNTNINLCCQNLNLNDNLKLTGDTTITQLKSLDIKYALIGHAERRTYYNETEKEILSKIQAALENGLQVIYCIGETKEEHLRKVTYQVLEKSLARILNNISEVHFPHIIIAYEPTYLIGGNTRIDYHQIASTINFIKNLLYDYYNYDFSLIYGGNINPENIQNFEKIPELAGYIVSSAILNPLNIQNLITNIS